MIPRLHIAIAILVVISAATPVRAIHLSFTNSSAFPADQVYVWFGGAAEAGYDLKIAGQSQNVTLGQSYSLSQLASGLTLDRLVSGRVYISFGQPLPDPGRNGAGSPIRYPGVSPGDDGYTTRWDFLELTHTSSPADVADLTSMDGFSIPLSIQLNHQGANLTGPNTSAGWKGHSDADVLNALKPLARTVGSNVFTSGNQFVRVKGANSFPTLYQNQPDDPKSMTAYLASIKAAGRVTTLDGVAFGMNYQYAAALDVAGNYVLNRTGGNPATPHTILIPATYKAGPNPADPIVTIAESLYMSNPWYGVDGGPVGPTQNNLAGAVARDLYAALNLGYVNSSHLVTAGDTVNPALVGKHVHELTGSQMRELTIGFGQVNEFHNLYAAAIHSLSDSYGYAYSDWNEHLTKVAVLFNQPHNGITADELNIHIAGTRLLPGDYNHDGTVDSADYTVWRNALHQPAASLSADGNHDGTIDAADYQLWKSHYGTSSSTASAALLPVPEPASAVLAFTSVFICAAASRRRNSRHQTDCHSCNCDTTTLSRASGGITWPWARAHGRRCNEKPKPRKRRHPIVQYQCRRSRGFDNAPPRAPWAHAHG